MSCSFNAFFCLLYNRKAARLALTIILTIHIALLAYSGCVHSPTLNEPAHLVAGLSHWKFGRFELYRVNPPLVRMVAAAPVTILGYEEDWSGFYEGRGARPVFGMGADFIAANGPRACLLLTAARWACIPFSLLGAIVCYLWARDLYGRSAGVLACALWCFEPNILGHASLITPDAHAAALGMAACYTFWKWLRNPTWGQTILTGVVLGLAELAKTTLILLYPVWPLLWLFYRLRERQAMNFRRWGREGYMLAVRMVIGIYVLNLGYGFEGSFSRLGDLDFVSELFAGEQSDTVPIHDSAHTGEPRNRFAGGIFEEVPIPFPRNYILGIDIQQRDFEHYGRPSYLRGQWQKQGWWYYYLYAAMVKMPLGLFGLGLCSLLARALSRQERIRLRDEVVLLAPAFVVFAVVSAKSGFSEHFRYALPAFPFLLIWTAGLVAGARCEKCRAAERKQSDRGLPLTRAAIRLNSIPQVAGIVFFVWFLASSFYVYPHSLSYFNELTGGPLNGHRHLLGSNLDWGQDLLYAQKALKDRFRGKCALVTPGSLYRVNDILDASSIETAEQRLTEDQVLALVSGRGKVAGLVTGDRPAAIAVSVNSVAHSGVSPERTAELMNRANIAPKERRAGYATVLVPLYE